MADLSITGEVVVNSEKAEGAFDRVGAKAGQMASKVQAEATRAGSAVDGIGAGAERGAEKFTRAESRMREAIMKSTRELEMLGKTASQKFEANLEFKGLDRAKFEPFLNELRKAEEATKRAEAGLTGMGEAAQVAGRAMALAFSGAALAGFVGKVVAVQREFDVLNSSLKTVTGSSAAAEREMSWLKDFAKETPFGLAQATQGFIKMKALGLDPTRAALTSFGNTASAMGKDLNQMIEAVADASTGEFERLKEFGIKAKKEGDNVSLTFQGVTTTIKNSAADITKYLEDIGNVSFSGAMEERAKTLDGTIAALGDTWDELFRTVSANNVGGLIFDSVKLANGAIEDAITILRALGGAAKDAGRDTGALSAIQSGIATVFETVAVLGANLKFVLVSIGNEIGGLAAQVAQAAQFNFAGVAAIRAQMVADAEAARKEIDATTARIVNARKEQEEYARYATRNASAATDPRRVDLSSRPASQTAGASGKAVKEELSEYDKLIQRLGVDLVKASAAAEAAQNGYNKAQQEFLEIAASPAWAKFTDSQRANVALKFEEKIASEASADAAKLLAKANADAAASREKYVASLATGLDKIRADITAQEEATARMGLTKEAIAELDAAKLEMLATDLELQAIKAMDRNLDQQTYDALKLQAEAYRKLAAAKRDGASKEMWIDSEKAAADAAKKASEDWKRTADDINRSLTDALLRGFESGKGFAKNLRDTLVNMFKTLVLRPIISAIISPVAGAITGALGLSGAANAATGAGGASNLLSGAGLLGRIGGGFGMGLNAGFSGLMGEAGLMGALDAGGIAIGAGNIMGGLGTIVGALGPIALGIGALFSVLKKLDTSGTYHTGGAAQYSRDMGLMSGQSGADYRIGFGRVEESKQTIDAVGNIAKGIGSALDAVAVTFGRKAGYEVATAFADDTSKDGAWGALRISKDGKDLLNWDDNRMSKWAPKEFADGEEGYKQYLAAVAKDTRQVLLDMDLPSWADTMLESLGDAPGMEALTSVIEQIGKVQTAFVSLGKVIEGFAGMTDEAFAAIVKASGGIEALSQNAATYYNNFYSDDERKAKAQAQLDSQFAELGIAKPQNREEFRKLVDQALAEADVQAKNRKALVGNVSTSIASLGKGGVTAADLGKLGFGNLDPALLGGTADPAQQAKLRKFLDGVNGLGGKGLDDAAFQQGIANLVEANAEILGIGDDAGKTAAALLGLSGAFAELNESAEQTAARIRKEQEEARNKAFRGLERAIEKEKAALQAQIDVANEVANTMQGLFDLLHDSVRDLYDEVESTRTQQAVQGSAFIADVLQTALASGYLPDEKQLAEAIASARGGMDSANYTTQFELDRDRLILAGQLSQLEEISGKQLTDAQKTLRELEAQSKQLDETLEYWREQIDIANGTFEATVSVEQAIRDLIDLTKPPTTNLKPPAAAGGGFVIGGGGSGGAPSKPGSGFRGAGGTEINDAATVARLTGIRDYTNTLDFSAGNKGNAVAELGRQAAAYGVDYREIAIANGYRPEDVARLFEEAGIPVPRYKVGTNYVPRDQFALLHEGEAVVPKAYNPAAGGMGGGRMEALLEAMVEQNTRLEIRLAAIEGHTQDTSRATNGNPVSPVPTALMENLTV